MGTTSEEKIAKLGLFREVIIDGKTCRVRVELEEIKEIGDFAYVGSTRNKYKKISKDEFMFIRFEPINTHIEETMSDKTVNDIWGKINTNLDNDLEYKVDRIELVKELIDSNEWIYELLSTDKVIKKEHKKKNSLLSLDQRLDKALRYIFDYIHEAKFIDLSEKENHKESVAKIKEIEGLGKKRRTLEDEKKLSNLISYIQSFHYKNVKNQLYKDRRTEFVPDMAYRETIGDFIITEEQKSRQKRVSNLYKKEDISDGYWDKMYPENEETSVLTDSIYQKVKVSPAKEFRKETLEQMKKEIEHLNQYLGSTIKDKDEKRKHKKELINKLNKHSTWGANSRSGQDQFNLLRRMLDQLKGNYELAKKILTDELRIKTKPNSTNYNINADTWYENESRELTEVSKNTILLSEPNTYKGLILNYKDLKDKYYDRFNSDIWALLMTFEDLLKRTEFTYDESFVLECLFENMNQTQIREKYEKLNIEQMTNYRVSNLINNIIPNKILNTYLDDVEEWLYVYKIKGKYKTCSKCGEVKLISNDRYFRKHPHTSDGFQSQCRTCGNS